MNQKQVELFSFYSTKSPSKKMHFINYALTPYEANNFFIELGESLEHMKEEKERREMFNPGDYLVAMEIDIQIKDMENLREDLKNSYEYNPKFYNSMNDFFTKGHFDLSHYSEEEKELFSKFLEYSKPEEDEEDIYGLREKIENKQTKLTGKKSKHRFHP